MLANYLSGMMYVIIQSVFSIGPLDVEPKPISQLHYPKCHLLHSQFYLMQFHSPFDCYVSPFYLYPEFEQHARDPNQSPILESPVLLCPDTMPD